MVSVIFPAAGQGKRMHAGFNKVFLEIIGESILLRTLRRFSEVPAVQELVVVTGTDEVAAVRRRLSHVPGLKPLKVVAGGSERQYSVWNGLRQADPQADIVLVHDAARPLVTPKTIEAVIAAAQEHGAAVAAVPAKNTVKIVKDGIVTETPDRSTLWSVQTPQGFHRDILVAANEKAEQEGFLGTDDASLVEHYGMPVHVVMDSYRNIKITTPEDLIIAEAFLRHENGGVRGSLRKVAKRAGALLSGHCQGKDG